MAFIALTSQVTTARLQGKFLDFQILQNQNRIQECTTEMAAIQKAYSGDKDSGIKYDETEEYKYWEMQEEILETEANSLNAQKQVMDQEVQSLEQLIKTNIKSSCGLTLAGG